MNTIIAKPNPVRSGKIIAGIAILAIGCILLMDKLNVFFVPAWLFSWPMWLIVIGFYIGARHNFRMQAWIIIMALGVIFLFTQNIGGSERLLWPIAVIGAGAWMLFRRRKAAIEPNTQSIDKGCNC